jgi:hypothetical protein
MYREPRSEGDPPTNPCRLSGMAGNRRDEMGRWIVDCVTHGWTGPYSRVLAGFEAKWPNLKSRLAEFVLDRTLNFFEQCEMFLSSCICKGKISILVVGRARSTLKPKVGWINWSKAAPNLRGIKIGVKRQEMSITFDWHCAA